MSDMSGEDLENGSNNLSIQRTAGGTPGGDGVKSSEVVRHKKIKKQKAEHVIYPWKAEILRYNKHSRYNQCLSNNNQTTNN